MTTHCARYAAALIVVALALMWDVVCDAQPAQLSAVAEAISSVRRPGSLPQRASAAEHLYEVVRQTDREAFGDAAIASLISLLDDEEDAVRFWVAGSLALLGNRARVAIP